MSSSSPVRILWLGCDGAGSNPPAIALILEWMERGHHVTFVGNERQRAMMEANHIPFEVLEQTEAAWKEVTGGSDSNTFTAMAFVKCLVLCGRQADELREVYQRHKPDRLVVDAMMTGMLAGLDKYRDAFTCPVWLYLHSTLHGFEAFWDRFGAAINGTRQSLGLDTCSSFVDMRRKCKCPGFVVSVAELETESSIVETVGLPVRYIGPRVPPTTAAIHVPGSLDGGAEWEKALPWPLAQTDDPEHRPLVLVSFTTLPVLTLPGGITMGDQRGRIRATLEGLADTPGRPRYRVLLTYSRADVSEISCPANAVMVPYAPHRSVLPHAAVCVTHCGHSTFSTAMSYGVPVVCLPSQGDQLTLSAKAESAKLGVRLDGETVTAEELRMAVDRVVGEAEYAVNARKMRGCIAEVVATPFDV